MSPSGPGISPKAPISNELKVHSFPVILVQNMQYFLRYSLTKTAEEIVKEKVRVFCHSYRIFGPDSFLSISTRNFATKRNFKALTKTL